MNDSTGSKIQIGISSCLLGEKVRFDGNHKHDHYITDTLGRVFQFVPFCPEVAIGLGVPREPIRLEGDPGMPRAIGVRDKSLDVTIALANYGRKVVNHSQQISGFILKSRSPSCGMERVKVYPPHGVPRHGRGIFAAALMEGLPWLPVEEEGRLGDPALRDNFLERVFACHRWQQLHRAPLTPQRLVEFHTRHKLIVMAHSTEAYRALGRLVAEAGSQPIAELGARYIDELTAALKHRATERRHANVLHHLLGYLKKQLDSADKAELLELIEQYRRGHLPLIVPLTLLRHHFRRHPHPYVAGQLYLEATPQELLLRSQL
ncbi:MAG TPA: DUF523 and DUF1722 domain-containing protein [Gammaproteobacteria bacterium]